MSIFSTPFIKICGITNAKDASIAARAGATAVGVIFWKGSLRYVNPTKSKQIISAIVAEKGIPVGVFVDSTLQEIETICDQTGLESIQLHGKKVHAFTETFSKKKNCILAVSVSSNGTIDEEDLAWSNYLDPKKDLILFDHKSGGTGLPFCWENFSPPKSFRWILAGGLHCNNISQAIADLNPNGVDVSSGVEGKHPGIKEPENIKVFIRCAQQAFALQGGTP